MGRLEHGRSSFNDHVRDNDKDNDPRDRAGQKTQCTKHFLSHLGGTVGFVPKETAPAQGTCWSRTKGRRNHNAAILARSLFTPRSTFWINPFGVVTPYLIVAQGQLDCGRVPVWKTPNSGAHIPIMPNVRTKIPIVEVIAPDGQKSLWVAAVAKANAVAAVKQVIPTNYVAVLSERRLTLTRKSEVLRHGEVRRIKL
jgi:hypothetical protein